MSQNFNVLLEVTANKDAGELPASEQLNQMCLRALEPMLTKLQNGDEIAERLALPSNVPLDFNISVVPRSAEVVETKVVPLRVALVGLPDLLTKLHTPIENELLDTIFQHLRKMQMPPDLAEALGYSGYEAARFELQVHGEKPEAMSTADLIQAQACAPGSSYSWSKGCNGWPG